MTSGDARRSERHRDTAIGKAGGPHAGIVRASVLGRRIELDGDRIDEPAGEVRRQLGEYAAGDRRAFDLSIDLPDGFTGTVHRALLRIPYGETRTYGDLAAELDTAPVAVGGACARNTLPVVVPCHRVVGVDSLRGYRYPGLKERLLDLEGAVGVP